MSWLSRFLEQRKDDLEAEMRAHIEMDIADRVSRGEAQTKPALQLGVHLEILRSSRK